MTFLSVREQQTDIVGIGDSFKFVSYLLLIHNQTVQHRLNNQANSLLDLRRASGDRRSSDIVYILWILDGFTQEFSAMDISITSISQ